MKETSQPAEPKPVIYEVVRITYYAPGSQVAVAQPVYVREKRTRTYRTDGWCNSSLTGDTYLESTCEESLTGLLTRILQALEQVGMEFVITPAVAQKCEFKKKASSEGAS